MASSCHHQAHFRTFAIVSIFFLHDAQWMDATDERYLCSDTLYMVLLARQV